MPSFFNSETKVCSGDCLLASLPPDAEPVRVGGKGRSSWWNGESLWLSVRQGSPSEGSLLGFFESDHKAALDKLMRNPVSGVLRVEALCGCLYRVPRLKGNVLFDANTIPQAMRTEQGAVCTRRSPVLSWSEWGPKLARLADALGGLHDLGLAHGDVTVFNVLDVAGEDPCWIDLENLNTDPAQRTKDTVSFVFFVLLFLCGVLKDPPDGLLPELRRILTESAGQGDGRMDRAIAELLRKPCGTVRSGGDAGTEIMRFLSGLGEDLRSGSACSPDFAGTLTGLLFRAAVYFQQEFLWLVQYSAAILRGEERLSLAARLGGLFASWREGTPAAPDGTESELRSVCAAQSALLVREERRTAGLQEELRSEKEENETLKRETAYRDQRIADQETRYTELLESKNRMEQELDRLKMELAYRDQRVADLRDGIADYVAQEAALRNEIAQLHERVGGEIRRAAELEKEIGRLQAMSGTGERNRA